MINIGNVLSHITLKKSVCDFPYFVCLSFFFFFYNLLKFDIINAELSFCKRGHNLETEAKFSFFERSILERGRRSKDKIPEP